MREFVLLMPDTLVADFQLNNLPKHGRLDELCRSILHTFFISDGFRTDTRLYVLLAGDRLLIFNGKKLRGINPDERSIGGILRHVFQGKTFPGIELAFGKLDNIIDCLNDPIAVLDENGENLFECKDLSQLSFIVGDPYGIRDYHRIILDKYPHFSLGPHSLLSSQCIVLIQNALDRFEQKYPA